MQEFTAQAQKNERDLAKLEADVQAKEQSLNNLKWSEEQETAFVEQMKEAKATVRALSDVCASFTGWNAD